MAEVSLQQILQAREDRVDRQHRLLTAHRCALVCFTMNIAGPVKTSPLIERGFRTGLAALERQLPAEAIRAREVSCSATGPLALLAVDCPAAELKEICVGVEEANALGRLFDMDVLDADGTKLERSGRRGCFVCGAPGRGCAARRLHPVPELQAATTRILTEHFAVADARHIAGLAVQSLLDEVYTTPKPGLVDRRNNGSHTDMTLSHFIASAEALRPYFQTCFDIGRQTAADAPEQTFARLRRAGIDAEATMYGVTGGVNTHKGAIYTMGVLCGAIGRLWTPEQPVAEPADLLNACSCLTRRASEADFAAMKGATTGERLYLAEGIRGIRGEAADGLPSVAHIGLPVYTEGLQRGLDANHAAACTLLRLIARVEDTNLHHRGGAAGARWAQQAARDLWNRNPWPDLQQLEELDEAFIARNLSPGGSADLLAATCFLHSLAAFRAAEAGIIGI